MSLNLRSMMSKRMEEMIIGVVMDVVGKCGEKYNFSVEEAMSMLGRIETHRKSEGNVKRNKRSIPLPYNGEICATTCQALRLNNGLYTQCQSGALSENMFCGSCDKLAKKSESGIPEYGTISQRKEAYDANMEYTDPKGRHPTAYTKVMKKYKLTEEQVLEEGSKLGMTINSCHFVAPLETKRGRPASTKEPKEPKGAKGRPKKEKKVIQIADDDEDIFATLVASANVEQTPKKSSEDKAAEKEAKKAAEKAEKEAKKAAEKAEKEAKKAAEKAEKEAKKAAEKEAKKAPKKTAPKKEESEEEEPEKVKKVNYEGKDYLVSKKSGLVYDHDKYLDEDNQDIVVVGKWNAEEKKVILNSSEESEDEYESDDE